MFSGCWVVVVGQTSANVGKFACKFPDHRSIHSPHQQHLRATTTTLSPITDAIMSSKSGMVDPAIFQDLQARTDEDAAVREVRESRAKTHT